MTLRDLYYNYTGYPEDNMPKERLTTNKPNIYGGGGLGNFFGNIGRWVAHPFNKTARYNASVQSNPNSYGSGEITNFNTTGNGTTDWGSIGGFATGQTSQNNITNPYQGTTMMEQSFAQTGTPTAETIDNNAFTNSKGEDAGTKGGGGAPWGAIIGAAGTNIANAFLDTEASTADRVAGALGISALAKQWTADTSKGDAKLKEMQNNLISSTKPNYIQDASSTWGANNAVKLNNKNIISPISSVSGLPSLKDFKGNWWRNMGASVAQGAASGSVGGPWGALGGAVTGLLGSIGGLFGRSGRVQKAYDDFLAKRRTLMSAQQSAFDKAVKDQTLSNMQALTNGNTQQRINDMANIRAYGGNLFDSGGSVINPDPPSSFMSDAEKERQMAEMARRAREAEENPITADMLAAAHQDAYYPDRLADTYPGWLPLIGGDRIGKLSENSDWWERILPYAGTVIDWDAALADPNWKNIASAGVSTALDFLPILRALKGAYTGAKTAFEVSKGVGKGINLARESKAARKAAINSYENAEENLLLDQLNKRFDIGTSSAQKAIDRYNDVVRATNKGASPLGGFTRGTATAAKNAAKTYLTNLATTDLLGGIATEELQSGADLAAEKGDFSYMNIRDLIPGMDYTSKTILSNNGVHFTYNPSSRTWVSEESQDGKRIVVPAEEMQQNLQNGLGKVIDNNTEYAMGGNLYPNGGTVNIADLFQNAVQKSAFTSLYNPYTIKRGETLSGIASRNNISLEDLINSNPEIINPSMINVGQQINLPVHFDNKEITDGVSDSLDTPDFLDYTVKQGDYMSKIAKSNNTTLEELQKANPQIKDFNRIFVGDIIHVPQNTTITAPAPKRMSLSERRTFEEEANKTNLGAIQGYRHDNNYAVIDKKNKTVTVYSPTNEVLYQSDEINTGLSGDDYNTITYTDKSGKIKDNEGNMSTPAGITEISEFGTYHNQPSYIRKRVGDETDIASSFHAGNIKKGSNGCVRMSDKTLQDLQQFLNKGTRVYTLPEKDDSRFVLKDGKLSFQADNPYGETDGSKKYWDDYNVYNDKTFGDLFISPNENFKNKYKDTEKLGNAVKFGNTLSENKEELQKYLGLSSGVYNDLAQLAMGIADQETKFGSSTKYSFKSNMPWLVNSAKWIANNNSANSQGITQIKYDADIRNEDLKKIYDDLGITKDSLQTPEGAAKATLARLAFIYKTEVLGKKFTGADDIEVSPLDALLYKYMGKNGELKNHTATPTLNQYIKNVNTYKNNFDYEGTFAMGGNLYTDLSPNMMSLWNNKQQIDQQRVNMQQMNFGLGNSFNQKLNTFDYGGSMNGMDLPTGMQSYENGGTHEENPYGGIQVGVDQQGNPNLVEEGEFRWGDYVFSDRISVDPTLLSRYNLAPATKHQGKKANKGKLSYADMAKKYAKKNNELANDPIGKNTLEAYMKRLQDAQEDQKFQDSMEQQKQDAINQYRNALTTPQQGNPMYGAMKYNGMGNAATQQGVNAGMSDLGQQGGGNEVLSNTNRSGNNMLHAFGGNLFWDGGTPQIKPKLLNVNPNLVLGDDYMNSWTANNAGTPRLFSSTTPMYTGENPEANFTAYQKRYPTLPSDAKGMQQLLVNEGFDIGNTGPNKDGVDGIWGNKSQTAWYDFLRAYNHRPNTMNQYDLIGSNNQPSTSNSQASYSGGLNLGVRDGDATTDANNLGDGQTSYGNAEGNTNIDRSNSTGNTNTGNTTTGTYATNAFKEDREGVPLYSTAGKFATFGKGLTPMLYDWMNKTNTKYDPNQRPANELVDMGNNSTFLRTADTIGGYRAPSLMDAERMNNAAQAQGLAALQSALSVGNGNRGFAAAQANQQMYNTGMGIGNNYATAQQANNEERYKTDAYNTAIDQFNANARNTSYQDNQRAEQAGQQMALSAKQAANDYLQKENWYADRTNRTAMDNRATNQAAWTDNALNYFITQAQENAERNRQNNDITKRYWSDKDGVMHYIGDSGLNGKIREYFRKNNIDNGTFTGDRLAAFNSIIQNNKAKDVANEKGELWSTVQGLMDDEIAARNKEIADADKAKAERLTNAKYAFDNNMAQLDNYRSIYGDKFTDSQWYDDLMKRYNDKANADEFNDINNIEYWNKIIGDKLNYWQRYNTPVTANQSAYGGRINNGNKNNKNGYYTYTY